MNTKGTTLKPKLTSPSNATIMIVDEDLTVRTLIGSVLKDYNFSILTAHNMEEALQKIRCEEREIQLLITNVTLPTGDGFTLSQEIKRKQPHLKTLFMSGYVATTVGVISGETFICKPFMISEMRDKVNEMMGISAIETPSPS